MRAILGVIAIFSLCVFAVNSSYGHSAWYPHPHEPEPTPTPTPAPVPTPMPTAPPSTQVIGSDFIVRDDWAALLPVGEMQSHMPARMAIHHTAVLQDPARIFEQKMLSIQRYHQGTRQAPDILYHFVVDLNGVIAQAREIKFKTEATTYDTTGIIHISLEGDFTQEQPTDEQIDSLIRLIRLLRGFYDIDVNEIRGHKDYTTTQCPGVLYDLIPFIRSEVQ